MASGTITPNCKFCGTSLLPTVIARQGGYCNRQCYMNRAGASLPFGERFARYIQHTATCWLWIGQTRNGYGEFRLTPSRKGVRELAHRISYAIHNGPIRDGLWVLHNCPGGDNPRCVNPDHLFLGSSKDNNQDRYKKGGYATQPKGEASTNAFLTEAQVRQIHDRYIPNKNSPELAAEFGIGKGYVWLIGTERRWKHLW